MKTRRKRIPRAVRSHQRDAQRLLAAMSQMRGRAHCPTDPVDWELAPIKTDSV